MGEFSPIHWIIVGAWALNVAAIVHIAVSDATRGLVKAAFVVGSIVVPVLVYLAWLALRKNFRHR